MPLIFRSAGLAVVLVAGCARSAPSRIKPAGTQETLAVASADSPTPGGKVVCVWEEPTGSRIPVRVCRLEKDVEATRQETLDALRAHPSLQRIED